MLKLWRTLRDSRRRALVDLLWLNALALGIIVLAFVFDLPRRIFQLFIALGAGNGEVGFILGVMAGAFAVFAARRWLDQRRAQAQYKSLFENAPVGVFRSTPNGRFLMANPALAEMLGYETPEELIHAYSDISTQLYVQPATRVDYLRALAQNGVVQNFENQAYRKDGSRIWILGNARAERDANGNIVYIEGNVQDITKRKETEQVYRHLVEQSLQAILIFQDGHFVLANQAAATLFGYTVQQLVRVSPTRLSLLIHADDRQLVAQRIRARLAGENVPQNSVFQIVRADRQTRWVENSASRIEYQGAPAILMVMADVTERKVAHDKMQENLARTHLREELSTSLARGGNDLHAVLNNLARLLVGLMGNVCIVTLISEDGRWNDVAAYAHTLPERRASLQKLFERVRLSVTHPFLARVFTQGEPILVPEISPQLLQAMGTPEFVEYIEKFHVTGFVIAPLRLDGRIVGMLIVSRSDGVPYNADDQMLLQEIADRAAQAISNAQLVNQLQTELRARRDAEEKYRALVEQIPAVTYIASSTRVGETLFVSPQIEILVGYSPQEWIATDAWVLRLHPDDRSWVLAHAERARHSHLPFEAEYRLITRDGAVRWVRDQARFVYDALHQPLYQQGIMVDITSYKRLEQKFTATVQSSSQERVAPVREWNAFDSNENVSGSLDHTALNAVIEKTMQMAGREQRAFANALGEAAALLNQATDVNQVLDGILDALAHIVPYDTASIFMREGNLLRMARARGFEARGLEQWIRTVIFSADLPKFQQLTRDATPIVIGETRGFPGWVELPETIWIRSHLTAPIRIQAETVGMLGLDSTTPYFYNKEHAARLTAFADLAAAALRNAQLLTETKQRAQEFRALYETIRDLSAPIEVAPLLETIVVRAMELLKTTNGFLFALEGDGQKLRLVVNRGLDLPGGIILPLGEGLAGQVALLRKPLLVNDYRHWEHATEQATGQGVRAALAVPITYSGNLMGVLGVAETSVPRQFNDNELSVLALFAGQAGAALETARLLAESRQRAEQLSLLYDVGLTLNRVLDARTQLEFLFKIAQRALRADSMAYFAFADDTNALAYELGVGVPSEIETKLRGERILSGEGAVGWIAAHRLPALIPEVNQDEQWQKFDRVVHSAVGVPVEHEQALRGVLVAVRTRPEAFTIQDERLLILFGNQIAAAMELTRLFQLQTQRQRELEILRQASLGFATTSERDVLTTLILEYALRLVTADNALLFFYEDDELLFGAILWANSSPMTPKHWTPRRDGFTHTVAQTGQAIVIDAVNTHPLFESWQWGGAIVGLPLRGGGRVRAVLNVAYERPHRFTPEELRVLSLLADQAAVALENARNVAETERQLRDAQLLHRAGNALNRTLAFDAAIETLAEFFVEAVGVQACSISTVDEAADEILILLDRDPIPETRVQAGAFGKLSDFPHLMQLVHEQKTLTYRRDAPDLSVQLQKNMDDYHWCSLLVLPLFMGEKVIGFVELADQHECRDFSPEVIRLAESLAHQGASALENASLFQETRRHADQLMVLNRIARGVNAATTLEEMVLVIEKETATVLHSDASFIALYDAATEMVDYVRVVDYGKVRPPFQWRLGPSLTRQVITAMRAVRMDDRMSDTSAENPPQFYGDGSILHSWLGVPIRSGDQVLGLISLQAIRRAAYSAADEQLLQTIADQVAPAIERAQRSA